MTSLISFYMYRYMESSKIAEYHKLSVIMILKEKKKLIGLTGARVLTSEEAMKRKKMLNRNKPWKKKNLLYILMVCTHTESV